MTGVESAPPQPLLVGQTMSSALLMFNERGDVVVMANVPGVSELGFFNGHAALGMVYLVPCGGSTAITAGCWWVLVGMLLPTALAIAWPFPRRCPTPGAPSVRCRHGGGGVAAGVVRRGRPGA